MSQEVFCTVSTEAEADAAIHRMKAVGLRLRDLSVAVHPDEVDGLAHPASAMNLSLKRGVGWGAVTGWLIGMGLVFYSNSPSFAHWFGAVALPISCATGWAMYGAIAGSTGLFSRSILNPKVIAHYEEEVGRGRILVAVKLHSRKELDQAAAALYELGATDLHHSGTMVA
jgi:hypothetical protein